MGKRALTRQLRVLSDTFGRFRAAVGGARKCPTSARTCSTLRETVRNCVERLRAISKLMDTVL
eukprot:9012309-Alexandrium_andersonii.AAC.1